MLNRSSKTSWLPGAATALAIVSCYGTTLLIVLLSLLGVSLAIDERAWAGAISLSAALAMISIAMSCRRHRRFGPALVATLGLACILWVMYGNYSRVIELAGFILLAGASLWDWHVRRVPREAESAVSWIEVQELADRLRREPRPMLIDVREADEFNGELGHLKNAKNISVTDLPQQIDELGRFRSSALVLVCRTQVRSAAAAGTLKQAGFRNIAVLRGGMVEWNRQGFPVEAGASSAAS
jgi:rhodanese-related sulfurtransferase